ncbi:MAG: hypothetical protein AAFU85_05685 [Planctomycetota bacterium]
MPARSPRSDEERARLLNYPSSDRVRCEVSWKGDKLYLGPEGSAESFVVLLALRKHLSDGYPAPVMRDFREQVMQEKAPDQWELLREQKARVAELEGELESAETAQRELSESRQQVAELELQLDAMQVAKNELERSLDETIEQRDSRRSKRPPFAWYLAIAASLLCCGMAIRGRDNDLPPEVDGVVLSEIELESIHQLRANKALLDSRQKELLRDTDKFKQTKGVKEWLIAHRNGEVSP